MNEIHQEIKGIVNGKYIDTVFEIDKVKQECKSDFIHVRNDIASIYKKIHQIETSELNGLREGNLILMRKTDKLLIEIKTINKVINTAIFREEFLREISKIRKLIEQRSKPKQI